MGFGSVAIALLRPLYLAMFDLFCVYRNIPILKEASWIPMKSNLKSQKYITLTFIIITLEVRQMNVLRYFLE